MNIEHKAHLLHNTTHLVFRLVYGARADAAKDIGNGEGTLVPTFQ